MRTTLNGSTRASHPTATYNGSSGNRNYNLHWAHFHTFRFVSISANVCESTSPLSVHTLFSIEHCEMRPYLSPLSLRPHSFHAHSIFSAYEQCRKSQCWCADRYPRLLRTHCANFPWTILKIMEELLPKLEIYPNCNRWIDFSKMRCQEKCFSSLSLSRLYFTHH